MALTAFRRDSHYWWCGNLEDGRDETATRRASQQWQYLQSMQSYHSARSVSMRIDERENRRGLDTLHP